MPFRSTLLYFKQRSQITSNNYYYLLRCRSSNPMNEMRTQQYLKQTKRICFRLKDLDQALAPLQTSINRLSIAQSQQYFIFPQVWLQNSLQEFLRITNQMSFLPCSYQGKGSEIQELRSGVQKRLNVLKMKLQKFKNGHKERESQSRGTQNENSQKIPFNQTEINSEVSGNEFRRQNIGKIVRIGKYKEKTKYQPVLPIQNTEKKEEREQ